MAVLFNIQYVLFLVKELLPFLGSLYVSYFLIQGCIISVRKKKTSHSNLSQKKKSADLQFNHFSSTV